MDPFDIKEAEQTEQEIVALLQSCRLVVEVGIENENPLVQSAQRVALHYLKAKQPKQLGAFFPGCLVVFLVGEGIFHYQSGAFWNQIEVLSDYDQNKLGDLRTTWLRALRTLGLDDFQDVVKSEGSLTYVLPALLHGGVPADSATEMWKVLLQDLQHGMDEPSQIMAHWKSSTAIKQQLNMPVQRFVQYGGALASDLLQRMIDLVLEYPGDLVADVRFDADAVARSSGVPAHLVAPLGEVDAPRIKRGVRIPTPVVSIDPYGGGGPELNLPAVPSAAVRSGWRIATPSTVLVPASPFEAKTISLSPPATSWNVGILDSRQETRPWTFEGVKSVKAFLFDTHTGALLSDQSRIRGTHVILLLGPGALVVDQTGGEIPEYEDGLQLFGDWSAWKLMLLDVTDVASLAISSPGSFLSEIVTTNIRVISNGQPPRIVESAVENVVTTQGDAVYRAAPSLDFSNSMLEGVSWSALFRHDDGRTSTVNLADLPSEGQVFSTTTWLSQFGGSYSGTLLVRGALGSDLRQKFAVISGLSIEVPPRIVRPFEKVSVPIFINNGQLNGGGKKISVVFEQTDAAKEVEVVEGDFTLKLIVSIARVQWALRSIQQRRSTLASEVVTVALKEIEQGLIDGLSVRTGVAKEISLELCREGDVIQSTQKVHSAGREGRWVFSLREFGDTIAHSGESRLLLRLRIESLTIDLARILTDFEATIETLSASMESAEGLSQIVVTWSEARNMKDREIRFWPLHRPWEAPVVLPIDDDAPCMAEVEFLDELLPGRYLCEIALRDDWAAPRRPSLSASNARDFPLGTLEQRQERWTRLNPTEPGNAIELILADVNQDADDVRETELLERLQVVVAGLIVASRDRRSKHPVAGRAFGHLSTLVTRSPSLTNGVLRELESIDPEMYRAICIQLVPAIYEARSQWSSNEDFYRLWTLAPELAAFASLGDLHNEVRIREWSEFTGWPRDPAFDQELEVQEPDLRGAINAQLIELPEEQLRMLRDALVSDRMRWLEFERFVSGAVDLLLLIKAREGLVRDWCVSQKEILSATPPSELSHRRALESLRPKAGQHQYSVIPQILLASAMDLVKSKGRQTRAVDLLFSGLDISDELTRRSIIAAAACEFFEQRKSTDVR